MGNDDYVGKDYAPSLPLWSSIAQASGSAAQKSCGIGHKVRDSLSKLVVYFIGRMQFRCVFIGAIERKQSEKGTRSHLIAAVVPMRSN